MSGVSVLVKKNLKRNKTSRILIENDVNLSLITTQEKKNHKFDVQFFRVNKQQYSFVLWIEEAHIELESVKNSTRAEPGIVYY